MSDKLMAGLVAAAAVAPICAVCVLGPAAVGSMFVGVLGWLGGAGPVLTIGLMAVGGALVYRTARRRKLRGRSAVDRPG